MKYAKWLVVMNKVVSLPRQILTLLLILTSYASSTPQSAAQQPLVAIHDSELTRALESLPAAPPTPSGPGTTGFQWWPTAWHYFVMPESAQETLRSDGTAFTVIGDSNITAGLLLPNGAPKYPMIISLASEAIRDDEIAPLTNYVAAGGFLMVGSSAFTRYPDGTGRGDFAFANELGLHSARTGLTNWIGNQTITKQVNHRLLNHLPDGPLTWRLPASSEEISWGVSPDHPFLAPHAIWYVAPGDAAVIAQGDGAPYLAVKPFGKGFFIYIAAFEPLLGHGGFAPGMYTYAILRKAIEWASETAKLPVIRLSPWPFPYDSAFMVRHDLENFGNEIAGVEASAQFEHANGVKGDYYFCTGTLRQDMAGAYDTNAVVGSLQRAISLYGATIGPHNGGLRNPRNPSLHETEYDFWHWGLDEALDVTPPGYANGKAYASNSLSAAFSDIEGWLPGLATSNLRVWVAPSFNATREDSYEIQSQLGVKITGEQKLSPFPHWTLSTRTSGRKYSFLSEPVSDWFVGGLVAQSLEPWHAPGVHTSGSMHDAVDFYYGLGALINLYSHTLSTGLGDAGQLVPDYITYCLNTNLHPRLWAANAVDVYRWWTRRTPVQISVNYITNGHQAVAGVGIRGATDPDTTVELLMPTVGAATALQVRTNGILATAGSYRSVGQTLKLRVGASVTNAEVSYILVPAARNDFYTTPQETILSVSAPGVLANDTTGLRTGPLTAAIVTSPGHGTVTLNADGSFTYTPATGFSGTDSFSYRASDGIDSSSPATIQIMVTPPGVLFGDDFASVADGAPIDPWVAQAGTWKISGGRLAGRSVAGSYGNAYYQDVRWTDYTVQASIQFSSTTAFGGGIGGRLDPASGAHYGAWVYPEGSVAGPAILRLIKFEGWTRWSFSPMQTVNLPAVGTNWHTLALGFSSNNIIVSFDGVQQINVADNAFDSVPPYTRGGISLDKYSDSSAYTLAVDHVIVTNPIAGTLPTIVSQPLSQTVIAGHAASFSVSARGTAPLRYQWRLNGVNIAGSTTSSYSITNAQPSNAGQYTVVITNAFGSTISASATLAVNYSLTVTTTSGGTVSVQPSQDSYAPGTTVRLTATPASGYKFTGWSGDASGTANPLTGTMNGNKTINPKFSQTLLGWLLGHL